MKEHVLLPFLFFYKCPHFVIHHSMDFKSYCLNSPVLWTLYPWTWTQHTMFAFFFFFVQNPPIHKHQRAFFSNPHWETCPCCFFSFFLSIFDVSSCFFFVLFLDWRTDYVHTHVICHWQTRWHADMKRCTACEWRNRRRGKESLEDGDTEGMNKWMRQRPNELLLCLSRPLFLEQQDACTNSVFWQTDNLTTSQRARLFEYNK